MKFSHTEDGVTAMAEHLKEEVRNEWLEKYRFDAGEISTIFLAWAPGAGKTEFIETISGDPGEKKFVILDTDRYRCLFEWYLWHNASEFQQFASRVMDKMYSFCMRENLRVIVDGTFAAKTAIIEWNIEQCARHGRLFAVVLVYQDPVISYLYTKLREVGNTRNVPFDDFVRKYFASIENTIRIAKAQPKSLIRIVVKPKGGKTPVIYENVRTEEEFLSTLAKGSWIDRKDFVPYTDDELRRSLKEIDAILKSVPKNKLDRFVRTATSFLK